MHHEVVRLAASSTKGGGLGGLLFPLVIVVLLLFFVTTSRRRRNAAAQTQGSIRPGAEIMTTAGLFGTVTGIDDDGVILLEVAPGVICRYTRGAISKVLTNGPDVAEDLEADDEVDQDEDDAGVNLDKDTHPDAGGSTPKERPDS